MQQIIDWAGLRAAAVAIGVREAARRAAADLPPAEQATFVERVLKRCQREGWIVEKKLAIAAARVQEAAKPLSAKVHSGAKAVVDAVSSNSRATRIALSRTALAGAKTFAKKTGDQVIEQAQELRQLTAAAAQIGGWDEGKAAGVQFKLLQIGGNLTLVSEGGDRISE